jgi:hypothetical protein
MVERGHRLKPIAKHKHKCGRRTTERGRALGEERKRKNPADARLLPVRPGYLRALPSVGRNITQPRPDVFECPPIRLIVCCGVMGPAGNWRASARVKPTPGRPEGATPCAAAGTHRGRTGGRDETRCAKGQSGGPAAAVVDSKRGNSAQIIGLGRERPGRASRGGLKGSPGQEVSSSVLPLVRRESHDRPRCGLTQRHVSFVHNKAFR